MARANVSKLFHQFGLVATLLLQHGLLYVYITYQHHVNKRLSIYYAVKLTIAQKFNPRCQANLAKSNYMRIQSIPLNRVVPVCRNRDPDKAGWPDCHVIKMLKIQTIWLSSIDNECQCQILLIIYEAGQSGYNRVNSPHVIGPKYCISRGFISIYSHNFVIWLVVVAHFKTYASRLLGITRFHINRVFVQPGKTSNSGSWVTRLHINSLIQTAHSRSLFIFLCLYVHCSLVWVKFETRVPMWQRFGFLNWSSHASYIYNKHCF